MRREMWRETHRDAVVAACRLISDLDALNEPESHVSHTRAAARGAAAQRRAKHSPTRVKIMRKRLLPIVRNCNSLQDTHGRQSDGKPVNCYKNTANKHTRLRE